MSTPLVDRAHSIVTCALRTCDGSPSDTAVALIHAVAMLATFQSAPRVALTESIAALQRLVDNMPTELAGAPQ